MKKPGFESINEAWLDLCNKAEFEEGPDKAAARNIFYAGAMAVYFITAKAQTVFDDLEDELDNFVKSKGH